MRAGDGCSAACSWTIRTARSFSSGEYRLGRPMGSILSTNGPSDNPATVHVRAGPSADSIASPAEPGGLLR